MHLLIAPNAFKNSLTAAEVAVAIQNGLNLSQLNCSSTRFPIADGGDGTATLILEKLDGQRIETEVQDALGRTITSSFGLIDNGKTAVIEMAESSGLKQLKPTELNPMKASSFGTGQIIKAALDKEVNKIILAMGGSATVDGGCGILSALGFIFLDESGLEIEAIPEQLMNLKRINTSKADPRILRCELIVICDVDNRLLGTQGTAAIFGPQKGADAVMIRQLDAFLSRLAELAWSQSAKQMDVPYGGTAGGAAAGLHAFLNAKLVNGIDYFLNLTDFDKALKKADILITGEGSIDLQTLQGKAPFGVAMRAKTKCIPVIGVAGKVPAGPEPKLSEYFNVLIAIGNEPSDLSEALENTTQNLVRTGLNIGNLLSFTIKEQAAHDRSPD